MHLEFESDYRFFLFVCLSFCLLLNGCFGDIEFYNFSVDLS